MSNPGNVRKLNALGGKRPQATGIVLLPKNRSVLATSEGSVANYGGNSKMGLYSNVGMSYLFQNTQLTGARINGNMPYFWGRGAVTKPAANTKNMITVNTLEDGTTIGFVADPYWTPISAAIGLSSALQNSHMGDVNSKPNAQIQQAGVIAIEKWRASSSGPSNNDVYIWLEEDAPINEVTFISQGVEVTLPVNARYKRGSTTGAPSAVVNALTDGSFPANTSGGSPIAAAKEFKNPNKAVALRIGDGTANAKLNAIFPPTAGTVGSRKAVAIYFK